MPPIELAKLKENTLPSGQDPEIAKKAQDYAKRDWQMSVEPLLNALAANESIHKTVRKALELDSFIAIVQKTMLEQKYAVLEKADDNKTVLAESELIFARRVAPVAA